MTRWINLSAYECDRKRTKNKAYARWIQNRAKKQEKANFLEKVLFT